MLSLYWKKLEIECIVDKRTGDGVGSWKSVFKAVYSHDTLFVTLIQSQFFSLAHI